MDGEDLYREVRCSRCGGTHLAVASFCPHCGYVHRESWFEKISKIFRTTETPATSATTSRSLLPALVSIIIGGYLLYQGIVRESIEAIIGAIFFLSLAFRAWFSPSRAADSRSRAESSSARVNTSPEHPPGDQLKCENCGAEVSIDAVECPECGMKFVDE